MFSLFLKPLVGQLFSRFMNCFSSEENDDQRVDDVNSKLARKIFACRPSANPLLIPKGGLKFSANNATEEEAIRLKSYYRSRNDALSSLKVRKLANLGLAEWLPDLSVAKIIRQGKFVQTQGFPHVNGYLALFPEEALFLLDVGDIELQYKGALLSLQDAFSLLTTFTPGKELCTLDEYCVYAHLCRMGYRVQRYSMKNDYESSETDDCEENFGKRQSQNFNTSVESSNSKKTKLSEDSENALKVTGEEDGLDNVSNIDKSKAISLAHSPCCRGWWSNNNNDIDNKDTENATDIDHSVFEVKIDIPNFACRNIEPLVLSEINETLIPKNTSSWNCEVEDIWYERLKKDNSHFEKKVFSFPKVVNFDDVCRRATCWSHYKTLVEIAVQERKEVMNSLHEQMFGGDVKPLLDPCDSRDSRSVYERLMIFQKNANEDAAFACDNQTFDIRFNIFQTDPEKPFRKTRPGRPLIRICVASANGPLPDFSDVSRLAWNSDGIPIKIALVNWGRILFIGFDNINIPNDILLR